MNETWWVGREQLNEEQQRVISLPAEGSHLIMGPPGCGKTNLLLLRGNYLTLAGQPNIVILVFTRTLQEFLAAGGRQYAFPVDKLKTCRRWQQEFLHSYGVQVAAPDDFDQQRSYFLREIDRLIEKRKLGRVYDAILLDESQDYLPEEIELFRRLATVLFAAADAYQKIYNVTDCMETLTGAVDAVHVLRYHYRIGTKICRLADALMESNSEYQPLLPFANYDEGARPSSVEHFRCAGIEEEALRIIERLRLQLKAYPDEMLGVLCPTYESLSHIWEEIEKTDLSPIALLQARDEHAPFEQDKRICVATLHAAKGLEVRALHVAGCETLKKFPHQRNMAFTAVTRAKTSLSLYYSGDIPGYLEKALASLDPVPALPKIEDVFGRKR